MFSYFAACSFFLMFSVCSLCSPMFLCVLAFICSSHLLHVLLFFLLWVLSCIQEVSNVFYAFEHMSNSRLSFTHVLTLQILDFHSLIFSQTSSMLEQMRNIAAFCSHNCVRRIHVYVMFFTSEVGTHVKRVTRVTVCAHVYTVNVDTATFRWRCRHCNGITTLKVDTTMSNAGWKTMQ